MKIYIYKIVLFCLFSGFFLNAWAQPTVDVCLRKTATNLEIVLTSSGSFTGLVSNIQMSIRCSDTTVTYGAPGDLQFFCAVAKGGDAIKSSGSIYQKFGGIGFLTLSTLGLSWATGTETVLFTVVPSSLMPTFEIVNDTWTAANNGAYYAELNAIDKTGIINTCGTSLPIEGLHIEANKQPQGSVMLNWATEKEYNGSKFVVLKRSLNNGFTVLDEVLGQGLDTYKFLDNGPLHPVNYYQIRQINPDGVYLLSNIVEISSEGEMGLQLYPNPAKREAFIQLGEINEKEKHITVHNSLGQVLMEVKSTASLIRLDVKNLAEGLYHVKVAHGNTVWEKGLVKISE